MPSDESFVAVTCTAPVNIAVIKYWGKRDEELILPLNSSLSVTLHQDQLRTTTTAAISRDFLEDRIWLNGQEEDVEQPRLQACLRETYTLARIYGVEGDLSEVARRGSGSACRSLYGGFVEWQMGQRADGRDSVAWQVASESHWPQLRVLILVVSAERKPTGSTVGMQTSVQTSDLLKFRAEALVPARMAEMARCIQERDFPGFAKLTMQDSNQFHATCLDTFPPISYLNDTSQRIMQLVHRFNAHHGQTKVAYTFDAGPNAVIFTLEDTMAEFVAVVRHVFPPEANGDKFLKGLPVTPVPVSDDLKATLAMEPVPRGVQYIIATQVGPGPQVLDDPDVHLLGQDGLPKPRPAA
ncbi:diphosphomevalonate decarboxylase isoform X2 [Octodon degus]|uniref:Diphosphomevalonate decarboxylase n=1 Tax=Octodon degus TaxID=10160 RepID=A0A6P6DLV5_OCTDE|nr:diphosphomevalonate decarboxylase isoform X2 [Octodon degus]